MTADAVDIQKLARELLICCHKVDSRIKGVTVYKREGGVAEK